MNSVNNIVKSISFFTFKVSSYDGIPFILNGLRVEFLDLSTDEVTYQLLVEDYSSLSQFTADCGGSINVESEKRIFCNSSAERHLIGMQMIESMKIAFSLQEVEAVYTKYEIVQRYGGAEEGGWYYYNYYAVEKLDKMVSEEQQDEEIDEYKYVVEFFYGQYEYAVREYYC